MAWTIPANVSAGTQILAATTNAILADLHIIGDAWTTYVPTWASSGTAPNLATNGGTLTGRYVPAGKLVIFEISLTFGGSSGIGTGGYTFTLPGTTLTSSRFPCGTGVLVDASGPAHLTRTALLASTTTVALNNEAGTRVNEATVAWAVSDQINILGMYEAA